METELRFDVPGTVYLIHFDTPLAHATHYLGWTEGSVEDRLALHRSGKGARILAVCNERGITYDIVRTWPGKTRHFERTKKARGKGKLCPICRKHHEKAIRSP